MGKDGKILVKEGIFVVEDPIDSEKYATIVPPDKGLILLNNIKIKDKTIVKENDVIVYEPPKEEPNRSINLHISKDKMKAYITILYDPKIIFKLKDIPAVSELNVKIIEKHEENKAFFTASEIEKKLIDEGIVFGIKKEVLQEISSRPDVKDVLVAEGRDPVDAVDDSIEFIYKENTKEDVENSLKAIDYKNRNNIESVSEGQTIGNITRGKNSILGKNLLGKEVRSKKNKIKTIVAGPGSKLNGNKVIALQDGQITFKNNVITVNKLYEVKGDVNMATGNINFQGDVHVDGNVTEGMIVCAKNNIDVVGGIYGCNVIALGDIKVNGNVIGSNVSAGGEDIDKELRLQSIRKLEEVVLEIYKNIEFVISNNLIRGDINLGEVVKSLIDTKYKNLNKICMEVISNSIKNRDNNSIVVKFIHEKLIGLAVLNINELGDLDDGINLIREEISFLEEDSVKCANVEVNYCQESKVQASGNVTIKGKGVFSTEIRSLGKIEFVNKQAVCRGGTLTSKKEIKASIIGSPSGVKTLLEVQEKEGQIFLDIAYSNTEVKINKRKYIIERPSKQVHCYIDSKGDLIVDKFVL